MASVKSVPIRDPENNSVVGQYFEPSGAYLQLLNGVPGGRRGNYEEMKRPDGRTVRVNRKLAARGHYDDKGYEAVAAQKKTKEQADGNR